MFILFLLKNNKRLIINIFNLFFMLEKPFLLQIDTRWRQLK